MFYFGTKHISSSLCSKTFCGVCRVWDARSFSLQRTVKVDCAVRAAAYSGDGKFLAIGFGNGRRIKGKLNVKEGAFAVLRTGDGLKVAYEAKDSSAAIRVIKFSNDGKSLAVGSDDRCIYVYNTKDLLFLRRCTIRCHDAPIAFIDFSAEGSYIVSADSTKRVFFSDSSNGVMIPQPAALKDEKWATVSNPMLWSVLGFWTMQPNGAEPTAAQVRAGMFKYETI
jgi:WD40 repeat protein